MIFFFVYTHDRIQNGVKEETSLIAVRRNYVPPTDRRGAQVNIAGGQPLFKELVMDEAYDTMFRRLFLEAHAEVVKVIPTRYLQTTPTDLTPVYHEFPDFHKDRDFLLFVDVGDNYPPQYRKSIDILIQRYLIDYICYRWFETKSPEDAVTFFGRLEKTTQDIVNLLNKRKGGIQRIPSFP